LDSPFKQQELFGGLVIYKVLCSITKDVEKHSIFVRDWPAGKWGSGSLPDDVKQNLKISMLELDVEKIMEKLYNGTHSPPPKSTRE
jgi:hypothetical protein